MKIVDDDAAAKVFSGEVSPPEPIPAEDTSTEFGSEEKAQPSQDSVLRPPESIGVMVKQELSLPLQAVHMFSQIGSLKEVSRRMGIALYDLQKLSRTQEWMEELSAIQREEAAMMNVKMSRLLDSTFDQIEDRLENGDYQFSAGKSFRKPCDAGTLAKLVNVIFDKRQLVRNLPTQIEASQTKLAELADKLTKLGLIRTSDIIDVDMHPPKADDGTET